jgi:hypothetical protein
MALTRWWQKVGMQIVDQPQGPAPQISEMATNESVKRERERVRNNFVEEPFHLSPEQESDLDYAEQRPAKRVRLDQDEASNPLIGFKGAYKDR